ncbi:hypothetical protein [Actinoplanes sp. M2I2]|uniref:hypothetical protein n=1 Tax=Actinoplanes sp. M2I2 TaxID=1734444 RepID=UPI002020F413|nr:hypothetical protein [Actinoplanes sp. M2I2]
MVALVGIVALYVNPGQWSTGWMSLALTARSYTVLLWPLALAVGAEQGRREHRTNVTELFATTPRSRARRMLPLLIAIAATTSLAYVLILVAGAVSLLSPSRYFPTDFLVISAVGALSLVAAAWLGLGIGRLVPTPATAPLLAVAGAVFVTYTAIVDPLWLGAVLSPMYGTMQNYLYQTIDARVSAAFCIWMAALALTGAVLLVADTRWLRAAAPLPALIGICLAVAIVPRDRAALEAPIDPSAAALVCTDDAPTICVSRVHAGVLGELTPLARQGLAVLNRLPGTPAEVHEDIKPYGAWRTPAPAETQVVLLEVTVDEHGELAYPDSVVPMVVGSLGVTLQGLCDHRHLGVERAAAYYLLGREPVSAVGVIPGVTGESPGANRSAVALWQELQTLPEEQALARIAAVRQAKADCRDGSELLFRSSR